MEFGAKMHSFLMSNKVSFFYWTDEQQGYFWNLPGIHTLDIGMFGPYAQISYGELGYLSELLDVHTLDIGIFGPYVQISDE